MSSMLWKNLHKSGNCVRAACGLGFVYVKAEGGGVGLGLGLEGETFEKRLFNTFS